MTTLLVISIVLVILVALGIHEKLQHDRNLESIPIRIHVNGTRGKSSVARLLASALRENGIRTLGKTTGTLPRIILPDGKEQTIYRKSSPNIIEQKNTIALAAKLKVDAIVIECMALQPYLQWISESKLVKATHTIITNTREDHLEIMGPEVIDVAKSLAGSTPINGVLVLGDNDYSDIYKIAVEDRGSSIEIVNQYELSDVTENFLNQFKYIEHKVNVALSLKLANLLNLDPSKTRNGLMNTNPDPGALTIEEVKYYGKDLFFANGFAANDPSSSRIIRDKLFQYYPNFKKLILVVNLREDRIDRTLQLAKEFQTWTSVEAMILLGNNSELFLSHINKDFKKNVPILVHNEPIVAEIFETILSLSEQKSLILGLGNIAGIGLELVTYFKNRKTEAHPH
jgi:poly-gamma-glutamate synthase PgsB/CapB